ncbi:MFS transporter [Ornithinibacillus halophilus]|uniref:Predicted arabinose efflux permease, MFS family n=1 Tax=Ornithinibacillus halophilus TaxID=930117 RepID=A0A1M5G3M1_9BACI|nr:MFS transporter [Ornithinibacillus halophilus]SHF98400.1 Predicted arabinose efflux permease, MFS family [Ornithinibacillus halophilus]
MTVEKNEKLIILAVALGTILNPLNTTMITVALPAIQKDFQLSSTDISWLIASYFIISAIFTPLIGKLSDIYGRKLILITGLVLVVVSSILAPLSPNMPVLLAMRGIQAIGTSALFPAGVGIIRNTIQHNQNRVIGTLAVFATTSAAFGPTIGGMLIQFGGWPVIFYVNLPILAVAIGLTVIFIPKDKKDTATSYKLDGIGILLFSLFITTWMVFLLGLEQGVQFITLVIALILTVIFYMYEKRQDQPFINVNFFRKNLNVALIFGQYILSTVLFFAVLLSFPTFIQSVLEASSQTAGIVMLSLSIFAMIMTPIATRWIERKGYRMPLFISVLLGLVGVILLFTVKDHSVLVWIGVVLAVMGISNGIQNIGLQNLLYTFISVSESGIASGLLMTSRFIGNILASSIYGVAFATGMNENNMSIMAIVLVLVAVVMIPGMLYVTKHEKKSSKRMNQA